MEPETVEAVTATLRGFEPNHAVAALATLLKKPGPLRGKAARALAQVAKPRETSPRTRQSAVDAAVSALQDLEPDVRKEAIAAVNAVGGPLEKVAKLLRDSHHAVRQRAKLVLKHEGSRGMRACAIYLRIEAGQDPRGDVSVSEALAVSVVLDTSPTKAPRTFAH